MEKKFKVPVRVTFTVVVDADVDVFANSEKEAKEIIDGYVSSRYYSDIMSKIGIYARSG